MTAMTAMTAMTTCYARPRPLESLAPVLVAVLGLGPGLGCADPDLDEPGTEAETGTDAGPSGDCPLEGLYDQCGADGSEGLSYCDEIDGALTWGPCLAEPACELGQWGQGCQICELVDGVPTLTGSPTCTCDAPAVPACEQTECAQIWAFGCDACQSFAGGGDCFSYSEGCSNPLLQCADLPRPCARVWAMAEGDGLAPLEDPSAATCVLSSLRDGVAGEYEILWGVMDDGGWWEERIYADGGGQLFAQWRYNCPGCPSSGSVGQSGVLALQPAAYFDDCLADPSDANLIACVVGLSATSLPDGYLPPFTTGTCGSLAPACP